MVGYAYGDTFAHSFIFCILVMSEFQLISRTMFSKYKFISNVNKMVFVKKKLVLSLSSMRCIDQYVQWNL